MKICTKCKNEKDIECFAKDKSKSDGLNCWCRDCMNNKTTSENITENSCDWLKQLKNNKIPTDNTKLKGDIAHSKVISRVLELGLSVLQPIGDNNRYDIVIEKDNKFYRIQIKNAWYNTEKDALEFMTHSVSRLNNGEYKRKYYIGDVDYFMVYSSLIDKVMVFDVNNLPKGTCKIRLTMPANGQTKGVRFVNDYIL